MTKQEFIDSYLLKNDINSGNLDELLEIRKKLIGEDEEKKDLEEYIKNSKHFYLKTLITPFGDCLVLVPKDLYMEMSKWIIGADFGFRIMG